jgi:dephospho-CoA kinase
VLVVPLLVESGRYRQRVARVAVVDCAEETQLDRVVARNGLARDEAARIMAAQAGRQDRLAAADDVIDNDGDRRNLRQQVEKLHRRYLDLAAMSSAR